MNRGRVGNRLKLESSRVALLTVLVVVGAGCGWPMFGYGPQHTRYNPTERAIGVGNVASLTTAWTGTTNNQIQSSPAIANGVVYVGSDDGSLYAFGVAASTGCSGNPKACAPLWSAPTGGIVHSSPAVANGVVYVGSDDGKVYAFDAAGSSGCSGTPKTCAPLWTAAAGAITGDGVFSSPAVANGIVYVGSEDFKVYAFDAAGSTDCSGTPKTCAPLWTATTGAAVHSSPAVANGVVYVGSGDGYLYAFDAAGSKHCSRHQHMTKACTPLWRAAIGVDVFSSPAVANGMVYVGGGGGNLYAFDAAGSTGCAKVPNLPKACLPLWTAITTESFPVFSSPAVANGVVYVASYDNKLWAFDATGSTGCSGIPKTCGPLWTATTDNGSGITSSPAVANGVVYIPSLIGSLYAFDATGSTGCSGTPKTCIPLWTGATNSFISSSPAIADGAVYVGSADRMLYAFKP